MHRICYAILLLIKFSVFRKKTDIFFLKYCNTIVNTAYSYGSIFNLIMNFYNICVKNKDI